MPVMTVEIRLSYLRSTTATATNSDDSAAVFLFDFFAWLEDGREQTLILHKRTIMVIFSDVTYAASLTARNVVFEITIEGLMFAVVNLQIGEVASTMLSC